MTPARPHGRSTPAHAGLLASQGLHLLLGALAVTVSVFAVVDSFQQRPNDGTVWLLGRPEIVVLEVPDRPGTPASTLRPGDRIIGIANRLVSTPQEAASVLRRQPIGSTVQYLVQREGQDVPVDVPLTPFRVVDRLYVYDLLLAIIYVAIGFIVYFKSLNDQAARLFFSLCLLFGIFFVTNLNRSSYFWGDIVTQNAGAFARFLLPALFLHFFLVFPEKKIVFTRFPFLEPLLYLLPAMFYVRFTLDQFFGSHAPRLGVDQWLVLGLYFCAGLIALLHSYSSYRDPLQKRRVRILTIGTVTAVVPFLIFKVALEEMIANSDLAFLGIAPLVAIPASFGYCIARYRVMQVERRGVAYTVLTGTLVAAYFVIALGLAVLVARVSRQTSQYVLIGATLAIAALLWPLRARAQELLNSRFFRTRSDLASVLQEFSRDIPRLIQREALLQRVGSRLCQILDLPALAVFLREETGGAMTWRLAGRVRSSAAPTTDPAAAQPLPEFPAELRLTATARRLEQADEPLWVEAPGTTPAALVPAVTREQEELAQRLREQEELARAGLALLVPLVSQGRLVGVFALPPKSGGDAYHVQDLDLLAIVASQVAMQIENSRLLEEEIEKQKLEEQLVLARTIQSRLLPSRIPTVQGAELSAINISSAQVSGDYYDLIERSDGCLGLVISDVSGKGIPASLLASSLQAALRAQCDNCDAPGLILQRVSRHLHASTDPQHFATLFLAFYDPRTRRLRYSSGGHNPPVLRRCDGAIELLEEGGLPLGAFDFGSYAESELILAPGDVLLLYTDGMTESLNAQDEEYGVERVAQALHAYHALPAAELIGRLREDRQRFSGRSEADDDVTLVALKVAHGAAETMA